MATRVLYRDATVTITETTSDSPGPDEPRGWRSVREDWAAGTPQAKDAALRQEAAAFLAVPAPTIVQTAAQVKALTRLLLGIPG